MEKEIALIDKIHYLYLPIRAGAQEVSFLFMVDGKVVTELMIPIGNNKSARYQYDYFAKVPMTFFRGENLVIFTEGEDSVISKFYEAVFVGDIAETIVKRPSRCRPKIHFTPEYGWINDPNGAIYYEGKYHLYFQYNPFNTTWNNICWGHAVSTNMLQWEHEDVVMLPDHDGVIFSGCGFINEKSAYGLSKDALLFCYTAAGDSNKISKGKSFVQKFAYSIDQGNTLIKCSDWKVPTICKENRDPKVFWHKETKAYIMCLWLEKNTFLILRSDELKKWKISQRFELDQGFECPDLFRLPVYNLGDNNNTEGLSKWVFWSADGYYYVGSFDGYQFYPEECRKEAYMTKLPYAAQTFSNEKNSKVISIPWLRTTTRDNIFTGSMGLPREFSLLQKGGVHYLKQSIICMLNESKKLIYESLSEHEEWIVFEQGEALPIQINTKLNKDNACKEVTWLIYETKISYCLASGMLDVNGEKVEIGTDIIDFSIIVDYNILEITAEYDIMTAVFELASPRESGTIYIDSNSIKKVEIYKIVIR